MIMLCSSMSAGACRSLIKACLLMVESMFRHSLPAASSPQRTNHSLAPSVDHFAGRNDLSCRSEC